MTTHIELPGGHWAELRDPMETSERERRPLKARFLELSRTGTVAAHPVGAVAVTGALHPMAGGGPSTAAAPAPQVSVDEELDLIETFEHEAIAFFVVAWDFPFEPSPDALYDLPVPCFTALSTAVTPLLSTMFPGLNENDDGRPTIP